MEQLKIQYQYFYDLAVRPRVTCCYIRDGVRTYVGFAVCSVRDMPRKKVGRAIAYQRALYMYRSAGGLDPFLDAFFGFHPLGNSAEEVARSTNMASVGCPVPMGMILANPDYRIGTIPATPISNRSFREWLNKNSDWLQANSQFLADLPNPDGTPADWDAWRERNSLPARQLNCGRTDGIYKIRVPDRLLMLDESGWADIHPNSSEDKEG